MKQAKNRPFPDADFQICTWSDQPHLRAIQKDLPFSIILINHRCCSALK